MRLFSVSLLFLAGIGQLSRSHLFLDCQYQHSRRSGPLGYQNRPLLSAFSLAYGIAQLPIGLMLDRLGSRIIPARGSVAH
jgi:MFS family permease